MWSDIEPCIWCLSKRLTYSKVRLRGRAYIGTSSALRGVDPLPETPRCLTAFPARLRHPGSRARTRTRRPRPARGREREQPGSQRREVEPPGAGAPADPRDSAVAARLVREDAVERAPGLGEHLL